MTLEQSLSFARDLARNDDAKLAEIGRKLLSIRKDDDLVLAVKMIQCVLSETPSI